MEKHGCWIWSPCIRRGLGLTYVKLNQNGAMGRLMVMDDYGYLTLIHYCQTSVSLA